jgi:hypothetical protein
MNIEEFYAADEARRESAEFEYGAEWTDANANEYELSWVEATGELYLMLGPEATVSEDLFFGDAVSYNEPVSGLLVKVIGSLATHEAVETALAGWEQAMVEPNSLQWLAARFPSPPAS